MQGFRVCVVGATGVVGKTMLKVLEERKFPIRELVPIASENSEGSLVEFAGDKIRVVTPSKEIFKGAELVLFAGGNAVARTWAPIAVSLGAIVVDNSSAFRMEPDVPLVVPEVNPEDIKWHKGIISNPNCCTVPLVMVLKHLDQLAGVKRVLVDTYQAASGFGKALVEELNEQIVSIASGKPPAHSVYPKQLAMNVVPGGWKKGPAGYNEEEWKIINESRKILHRPDLRISATTVRVPVIVGHAESVWVELMSPLDVSFVYNALSTAPGIQVYEDEDEFPTPLDVADKDDVLVGRVRQDLSCENGVALWIVSDNLRKGAALNAIQISELVLLGEQAKVAV